MPETSLIARIRQLIGDPASETQAFTDDDVQAALDDHRLDVVQAPLSAALVRTSGATGYSPFYHPSGLLYWGEGASLESAGFAAVTADDADLMAGLWRFDAPRSSPILYLTGSSFDPWGAAADLLEQGAALALDAYDFSADGQSFKRSQRVGNRATLVALYRRRQRLSSASLTRADVGRRGPQARPWPDLVFGPAPS